MRKYIIVATAIVAASACVNEKKATRWMDENRPQAAGYCAERFPVDTTSRVTYLTPDSSKYKTAYVNLSAYADSLFKELQDARSIWIPTPASPCPPQVNLDSLRKVIDAQIKRGLQPCKDSVKVVNNTVVDPRPLIALQAKFDALQAKCDQKDVTIGKRDQTITDQQAKLNKLRAYLWLFWGLIVLLIVYVLLKLRYKLPF